MKQYPIAEIFTSQQGEGQYTGKLMTFVRLAGCTVGKPFPKQYYTADRDVNSKDYPHELKGSVLPIYTEQCTLYDGRTFACDTNYKMSRKMTPEEILKEVEADTVCITGGEPLMHDLSELLSVFKRNSLKIHVETSGTIKFSYEVCTIADWITISPKLGVLDSCIEDADEIKLLVDDKFSWENVPKGITTHPLVYIQPVNYEHDINWDNVALCKKLQLEHKNLILSLQMHKVLRVK